MKRIMFFIIGLLAILLAFLINIHVVRIFSLIIGICFITYQIWFNNQGNKIFVVITEKSNGDESTATTD